MSEEYCHSLTKYKRRITREVNIGGIPVGGKNPIRVQSMTTVDTMDTHGSIEQCIRMIESGCEYIRITAPSVKEAHNLENIKAGLRERGYNTPLIADIHFTPNAAEIAARIVEKVRVNPGNYADKKKFQVIEYDDASYAQELERIRAKFSPLVKICKEHGTAMRIGTNHGSLSDRIMSRYGDTPMGMVESALEFIRICEDLNYYDLVISMKSSNPQVMVQAYRLLVNKLEEEGLQPYPLHLGVTEAGEGEDGRIKSAMGIGTLLEDGLGDTVRVSLTEEPEMEAPVAQKLVDRYVEREQHAPIPEVVTHTYDPFAYQKRNTVEVGNLGGQNVPRVIADFSFKPSVRMEDLKAIGHTYIPLTDKWGMNDTGADFIYSGQNPVEFMLPNGLKEIQDANVWMATGDAFPMFELPEFLDSKVIHPVLNFVKIQERDTLQFHKLKGLENVVLVASTTNLHAMADLRRLFFSLQEKGVELPVVISRAYEEPEEVFQLYAATDAGGLLLDGFGDGVMISHRQLDPKIINSTVFGILQAARTRITRTEYISCPSCGRTLFDLQETTAMIRKRTDHLKGVKIGIMGCIVNGPGEMADADYGYVGSGVGKITLYKGQEVVKRGVPSAEAVDELIELIKAHGEWVEPEKAEA